MLVECKSRSTTISKSLSKFADVFEEAIHVVCRVSEKIQ